MKAHLSEHLPRRTSESGEKIYQKKGEERQHILALLHINWEIMYFYFILSASHTPTSHNKCDCAKTGPAPLNDVGELPDRATQILNQARQSRRQGTKGSSFIQHLFGTEDGRRECGRGRLHESFISQPSPLQFVTPNMCEDEDDIRLGRPAGTEIKTCQSKSKCVSYLHPFFFMMFPSTTSALQGGRGEKAGLNRGMMCSVLKWIVTGMPRIARLLLPLLSCDSDGGQEAKGSYGRDC